MLRKVKEPGAYARYMRTFITGKLVLVFGLLVIIGIVSRGLKGDDVSNGKDTTSDNALQMVSQGRQIFRFDTFGDQAFWGETLKLHQAIEGAAHSGVGPGVSPKAAL